MTCVGCREPITEDQTRAPVIGSDFHVECMFREVMGGIGHHENHPYWCLLRHDPDGGRTDRQSALEVWAIRESLTNR